MTGTVTRNRDLLLTTLLLAIAFMLSFVASAHAGEWVQRSCSYGTEYIFPEGWEGKEVNGFVNRNQGRPFDGCLGFNMGGGLDAEADGETGNQPGAGEIWLYRAPHDSTIAGGLLTATLTVHNGDAMIGVFAKNGLAVLANCESPNCHNGGGFVPITASGGTELYEEASCFATDEGHCPLEPNFAAEAGISSAQIVLATSATPAGSGFSGTLLKETVTGKGTLSFTATDPGPGVFQARVRIDGQEVWSGTPSLNEGKCVVTGTEEGARVFNYAQPCPSSTPVSAEIDTTSLADGAHHLAVEVEDAAGNVATVYSGMLTTANHPVSPIILSPEPPAVTPPNRGAANGTPASENAMLTVAAKQPASFTRNLAGSTVTLTGRLTDATGTPIKGAQVQLSQQVAGTAAASRITSATTGANGTWTLKAQKGPSRLLQVAYFSHMLDTTPAAVLDFHEQVKASVSLRAPKRVRNGQAFDFTGQLAGGYIPPGGESIQMELYWNGRWRTIEVLPTSSRGTWGYRYVFTAEPGTYKFRAVALPNAGYPFASYHSRDVSITVRR